MTKTIYQNRMEERRKTIESHIQELAAQYGVVGHPKLGLLYQKAWDLGHSSGYDEVAIHFGELVDLIR